MYVAESRRPAGSRLGRVPGAVLVLGTVSLLTDVSSEMVTAFLPLYLVYTLQIGFVQFGLLDGLYTGATAALRLVGGFVGDRWRRHRLVAGLGYGLSALTRVGLLAVGSSAVAIGALVATDRAGKGLRTAPRDAMIAAAVPPERLGVAFGIHRTMDTTGAFLGPLVTFLLLLHLGTTPAPIFVVSFGFAVIGLIVLAAFGPRRSAARPSATAPARPTVGACLGLLRDRGLRRVVVVATVLGLATLSDAFLYLLIQKSTGVSPQVLPLLPLGTAVGFLLAATPVGRLADRVGRRVVFLAGHVLLLAGYALLLGGATGPATVVGVLALHGLFYAATDGVLSAWVAQLVPEPLRGSGLAVVQTGQAVARFGSSAGMGIVLSVVDTGPALLVAVTVLTVAIGLAATLGRNTRPAVPS